MKKLKVSRAAERDLENIWLYTVRTWNISQADRYLFDLRKLCTQLACGERVGRQSNFRPGYFKASVGAHMIYFRMTDAELEVIRILHGKQDVERHL